MARWKRGINEANIPFDTKLWTDNCGGRDVDRDAEAGQEEILGRLEIWQC
jgi:hypothetical protein